MLYYKSIRLMTCLAFFLLTILLFFILDFLDASDSLLMAGAISILVGLRILTYGNITLERLHKLMINPDKPTLVDRIYPFDLLLVISIMNHIILNL